MLRIIQTPASLQLRKNGRQGMPVRLFGMGSSPTVREGVLTRQRLPSSRLGYCPLPLVWDLRVDSRNDCPTHKNLRIKKKIRLKASDTMSIDTMGT